MQRDITRSTHMRALVFADTDPTQVAVYIDGVFKGNMAYTGRGSRDDAPGEYIPLWTTPWSPSDYDDRQPHRMRVVATDAHGRVGEDSVLFRVDGQREELDAGWSSLIIHSHFESFFRRWFLSLFVLVTAVLLLPQLHLSCLALAGRDVDWRARSLAALYRAQSRPAVRLHQRMAMLLHTQLLRWRHRFYAMTEQPAAWTAIYGHFLWIICMPLCPALLFYNNADLGLSWVYLYGVWVDNRWLPMLDTWAMPTVMLGLLEFWALVYIVVAVGDVDLASSLSAKHPMVARPYSRKLPIRLCVALYLLLQIVWHVSGWRIGRWPSLVGGIGTFWWVCTQTWLVWRYGFSASIIQHAEDSRAAKTAALDATSKED
ncbi:hypothetical protein SYNPS1DRAFT_27939 [Syncephalis pseudoplumigaleata]|uniref:TMEM62 Ig-like domain-containing protein n=1 Tax=Syncephalis pseudoplumigaleata TaxID=1712513 RepID=A0A4P9Z321_9FUNG|nr:hypothetical protein SYNPS1DRAFT_27939 [Syncephalis pseudoplumigaleata]|eukprot:RKP26362.1 hypothetical protein SYNPS1DRAFT_27939 [Syncephalis pseudoplumigaleata]